MSYSYGYADGHFSKQIWAYTLTGDKNSPVVYRSGRYCGGQAQFEVLVNVDDGGVQRAWKTFIESEVVDNELERSVATTAALPVDGRRCPACIAWNARETQ